MQLLTYCFTHWAVFITAAENRKQEVRRAYHSASARKVRQSIEA